MVRMYSPNDRKLVHDRIVTIAQNCPIVTRGADIGSAANNSMDEWSDIDITFGVIQGTRLEEILDDWTQKLDKDFEIIHYFDLYSSGGIYRVILFKNYLEMDLSVMPEKEFIPRSPNFRLLFGNAGENVEFSKPSPRNLIGLGWHHLFHAKAAIERRKYWHAEYWISGLRDHTLALQCLRYGKPAVYAKGIDQLPNEILSQFENSFPHSLTITELERTLDVLSKNFLQELTYHNPDLAKKLEGALTVEEKMS